MKKIMESAQLLIWISIFVVCLQPEASEMLPCMMTDDEARVVVLDEDHRGIFAFQYEQVEVEEAQQEVTLVVKRWKGKRFIIMRALVTRHCFPGGVSSINFSPYVVKVGGLGEHFV